MRQREAEAWKERQHATDPRQQKWDCWRRRYLPARWRKDVVEELRRSEKPKLEMVDALGKPWCYWDPEAKQFRNNKRRN